jgi:hypothetical protein
LSGTARKAVVIRGIFTKKLVNAKVPAKKATRFRWFRFDAIAWHGTPMIKQCGDRAFDIETVRWTEKDF